MALVAHPPMLKGGWLYSWGSGYQGQLAQGTVSVALLPTPVDYFIKLHLLIQTVAAGPLHCLAVTKEGELYSWGSNVGGCLGRCVRVKQWSCFLSTAVLFVTERLSSEMWRSPPPQAT